MYTCFFRVEIFGVHLIHTSNTLMASGFVHLEDVRPLLSPVKQLQMKVEIV
jgi:hypothetical protein